MRELTPKPLRKLVKGMKNCIFEFEGETHRLNSVTKESVNFTPSNAISRDEFLKGLISHDVKLIKTRPLFRDWLAKHKYLIGGVVLAVIILLAASYFIFVVDHSEGAKLLRDFPNKIPGAAEVNKYPVPGAQRVLIHIWQMHYASGLSDDQLSELLKIQGNIYSILSYLIENHDLKEVYAEGVTSDNFETITLTMNLLTDIESDDPEVRQEGLSNRKKISNLNPEFDAYFAYMYNLMHHITYFRLAREGKLKLLAGDDNELLKMAEAPPGSAQIVKQLQAYSVTERRENFVLKTVAEDDSLLSVLVYGSSHMFGGKEICGEGYICSAEINGRGEGLLFFNPVNNVDNIAVWNSERPDNKFSLIEIIPEGS